MEETLKVILDKLNSIDADIKDLKKHAVVIENEHGAKLDELMDGYKQLYEGQQEIKNEIR